MREAFWRFAHRRYHNRRPPLGTEITLFLWGGFFAFVYSVAILEGWRPDGLAGVLVGVMLTIVPLTIGALHFRIRIEAGKGPDALYKKVISIIYRG
jgi:hypothetical protein